MSKYARKELVLGLRFWDSDEGLSRRPSVLIPQTRKPGPVLLYFGSFRRDLTRLRGADTSFDKLVRTGIKFKWSERRLINCHSSGGANELYKFPSTPVHLPVARQFN